MSLLHNYNYPQVTYESIVGSGLLKPGEQCNVVFALIVTESANEWGCVGGMGAAGSYYNAPPPPPLGLSVTIYAKTTADCSPDSSMAKPHLQALFLE